MSVDSVFLGTAESNSQLFDAGEPDPLPGDAAAYPVTDRALDAVFGNGHDFAVSHPAASELRRHEAATEPYSTATDGAPGWAWAGFLGLLHCRDAGQRQDIKRRKPASVISNQ